MKSPALCSQEPYGVKLTIHPISHHSKLMFKGVRGLLQSHTAVYGGCQNSNPGLFDSRMPLPVPQPKPKTQQKKTAEADCLNQNKKCGVPQAASRGVSGYSCQLLGEGAQENAVSSLATPCGTGSPVSRQQQCK